jgi:ABC-2 type transport system permease protein
MNAATFPLAFESRETMSGRRLLGAYLAEAKYESLRALRSPAFAIPFLVLPIALYLLFGILLAGSMSHGDPRIARIMFVNWSVFGIVGPGLFGFGIFVAQERGNGVLTLKRALPMPPAAYVLAKMFMTMVFAVIIMATLIVPGLSIGHLKLDLGPTIALCAVDILGALPFAAIGLFVGTLTSGKNAPAFLQLAYQPIIQLGGLFYPLPKSVQPIEFISPAFYLAKLGLRVAGVPSLDELASGSLGPSSHGGAMFCVIVLTGVTLLFGMLAVRRLRGRTPGERALASGRRFDRKAEIQ